MSTAKDLYDLRKEQNICHKEGITAIGEEFREMCEEIKRAGVEVTKQLLKAF